MDAIDPTLNTLLTDYCWEDFYRDGVGYKQVEGSYLFFVMGEADENGTYLCFKVLSDRVEVYVPTTMQKVYEGDLEVASSFPADSPEYRAALAECERCWAARAKDS